jgi:hypothetical protein
MSRHPARKPSAKPKPPATPPPNLPEHNLPEPYARLMTLGQQDATAVYEEIAALLRASDARAAAQRLTELTLDESFYSYFDHYDDPQYCQKHDPRVWTNLHALRVLMRLGEAAHDAIEPLTEILDTEDDFLREELPLFFGAMGPAAIEPLARILTDPKEETWFRIGASNGLQQIGEDHPELRAEVVSLLEQTLADTKEDSELVAFLITDLMDLGSRESLPLIEQAFQEDRVDDFVVSLDDVREHFGLPRQNAGPPFFAPPRETPSEERDATETRLPSAAEPPAPYISELKVGRNDPCPCGSGLKYKKCHGK